MAHDLVIEHDRGVLYTIRNTGTTTIDGVTIHHIPETALLSNLPTNVTLRPNEDVEFIIMSAMQSAAPRVLEVTWDTQPDAVLLSVPKRN